MHAVARRRQASWCCIADPFDAGLRPGRRSGSGSCCVGAWRTADVAAYLARHEETLRAMDSVLPRRAHGSGARRVEDLSLKTISEDTSPVVKLVHSTLYDALKTGASDIHLETGADRPGHQVPHRRRAAARSARWQGWSWPSR